MKTMPRDYVKGLDGLFRKVEQFPGDGHTEILVRDSSRRLVRVERISLGRGNQVRVVTLGRAVAAALALFLGVVVLSAAMRNGTPTGRVGLAWDYPINELSTNLVFRIWHSTNIAFPLSQWTVITNIPGTNTRVHVFVTPGVNYFAATASNFWGESDFSDVVATPALPRSDVAISIRRAE